MTIQNPICQLRHLWRKLLFGNACALLILVPSRTAQAAPQTEPSNSWFQPAFYIYGIAAALVVLLAVLMLYKRHRGRKTVQKITRTNGRNQPANRKPSAPEEAVHEPSAVPAKRSQTAEAARVLERPAEAQLVSFGAFRVDQEVNKLVEGEAYRTDVMASRAADDRRAIEASLIKALESSETDEDGRRRAQEALEEYGFVARQSATMLQGRDAWERSSAARTLGQIGAPSSLPFLIEALHDNDSVVRNQAVTSLGSLRMPSAIGVLLDIAHRHPDIPASLLSETLSACSIESLDYLDAPADVLAMRVSATAIEPMYLEKLDSVNDLPSGDDDSELTETLAQIENADERARAMIAQQLSMYPVQRSVAALTSMVVSDPAPAVRAAAVASLSSIDHESVFAPVLLALADETRIVQAAAARTLTGLSFDRADVYVRLMETASPEMLREVAQACIKTGIVAQAVDRLASEDRQQAYEAFSLFSLLARANEMAPILDVIENHPQEEARLCAVHVISVSGQSSIAPRLREIAGHDGTSENVRSAVLEVLFKFDQDQAPVDLNPSDNMPVSLHNST